MSLTLAEARARAALLSDVSYRLHLDLTDRDTFGGPRRGRGSRCAEPGASTFLELADAREVLVDGAPRDDVRREPDRPRRARRRQHRDGRGPRPVRDRRRRHAHLHRPGRRRDLRVGVRRDGHLPAGLPLLRPERPQGAGVADRHRARGLDRARQRPGASRSEGGEWEFATTPPIPLPMFVVCAGPWHSRTWEHAGLPFGWHARALARRPARPRLRRAAHGHRALLRPLHRDVRRAVRLRLLRPGLRARDRTGAPSRPPAASPTATRSCRSAADRRRAPAPGDGDRPRDGPHVVRRPGHHDVVGGHLAAGVLRRLHGLPGRRRGGRLPRQLRRLRRSAARPTRTSPTSGAPPTRSRRWPRTCRTSTPPSTTSTRSPTPRATPRCDSS